MDFLEPQDVDVTTLKGDVRKYQLSKFPAIAGREIIANYPLTAIPKASDYGANEAVMLKLMCYVGAYTGNGTVVPLTTRALVNNHVPDYETLVRIEIEMMRYNTSFFGKGEVSTFLKDFAKKNDSVSFPNVDALVGAIVGADKASLYELKTRYTLEDALDLFEIIAVQRFNEWLAMEQVKKGGK